jgi:hypothetical protein
MQSQGGPSRVPFGHFHRYSCFPFGGSALRQPSGLTAPGLLRAGWASRSCGCYSGSSAQVALTLPGTASRTLPARSPPRKGARALAGPGLSMFAAAANFAQGRFRSQGDIEGK